MTMFASVKIPPALCGADDCTGCQSVQHNEPNPILVEFRYSFWHAFEGDLIEYAHIRLADLASPRMQHGTFMTGAGIPPLCSCGWQGKQFTGPILAEHQREARQHVEHARRVLTRLARFA
jgi:hypothetical protein